jgi:hypothetical protein
MAVKYTIARHSKIYPNCDFWPENIPSGNPTAKLHMIGSAIRLCSNAYGFFSVYQIGPLASSARALPK